MVKKKLIIKDNCLGCGTCIALCPAVFELREDGKAKVKLENLDTEELKNKIEEAIEACPVSAIVWEE